MNKVRTRFAPSPTGALHAGTVRTALFAWLVARQNQGEFILRIEDTDQARSDQNAINNITATLKYVGLDWDEGPGIGGKFGPYTQSERLDIYRDWANKLIENGRAYPDNTSQEHLEVMRQADKKAGRAFLFRNHRPKTTPAKASDTPLRFLSDPKSYSWVDLVMGDLSAGPEAVDDFILIKSDGYPTYNFAHIIDDYLMDISHVIRSQEFISSVPKYLNLYEALGIKVPLFATVPQVVGESGTRKLSKREGAKQLLEYQTMGVLPEAMLNFLATIGWNDGSEQEIFSKEELIKKFTLQRVQRSPGQFDEKRLLWLNGHYIRELQFDELVKLSDGYWSKSASKFDQAYKNRVLKLVQSRLKYLDELGALTSFFFEDLPIKPGLISTHKKLKDLTAQQLTDLLTKTLNELERSDFSLEDIKTRLDKLLEETSQTPAVLFSLIRIATTQSEASPELAESLEVLGKDTVLRRIKNSISSTEKA
ncbi:MAG TPA: glutamate--tRNA ligase [Candidatus Saccharimonadales bacterium]|nr:glutamate--tRNA ligase [Candidatus Saccharimonadales bacterium]